MLVGGFGPSQHEPQYTTRILIALLLLILRQPSIGCYLTVNCFEYCAWNSVSILLFSIMPTIDRDSYVLA